MPAPFSILTLDFHNTVYDEVLEYGLAIDDAIAVWLKALPHLKRETLCKELSEAHRQLGSDWDEDAWRLMPCLKAAGDNFETVYACAVARRREKSKELTVTTLYAGLRETLTTLKKRKVRIYVITEAAADAGVLGLDWLGLGGLVDGFYSYPSRAEPLKLKGTYQKTFPPAMQGGHLKKPHPFLIAAVALDEAQRHGRVPADLGVEDVFRVIHEKAWLLDELPPGSPVQRDVSTQLTLKQTPYAPALKRMLDSMLYVGDSKFRDGMLARNAGVAFGFAAYGKKISEAAFHARSLAIMYEVTGWEKEVLQLTQEAGKSRAASALKPDYIFQDSLAEALPLFI